MRSCIVCLLQRPCQVQVQQVADHFKHPVPLDKRFLGITSSGENMEHGPRDVLATNENHILQFREYFSDSTSTFRIQHHPHLDPLDRSPLFWGQIGSQPPPRKVSARIQDIRAHAGLDLAPKVNRFSQSTACTGSVSFEHILLSEYARDDIESFSLIQPDASHQSVLLAAKVARIPLHRLCAAPHRKTNAT